MSRIGQCRKFAVSAIGMAAVILAAFGVHDTGAAVIIGIASALGVYAVPNRPAPATAKPAPPPLPPSVKM